MNRVLAALIAVCLVLSLSGLALGFWGPQTYIETQDGKLGWVSFKTKLEMIGQSLASGRSPIKTCAQSIGETLRPPLEGEGELGFGFNKHPLLGKLRHHAGVDFERSLGTPVKASAAGRVTFVHHADFYGLLVIVAHDANFQTLYAHLDSASVTYGQCVVAGETIGMVGSTGLSKTPHLHFEIRKNEIAVDPKDWLPNLTIN